MKKLLLTLFVSLSTAAGWAQTAVTTKGSGNYQQFPGTEGKYYTIKNENNTSYIVAGPSNFSLSNASYSMDAPKANYIWGLEDSGATLPGQYGSAGLNVPKYYLFSQHKYMGSWGIQDGDISQTPQTGMVDSTTGAESVAIASYSGSTDNWMISPYHVGWNAAQTALGRNDATSFRVHKGGQSNERWYFYEITSFPITTDANGYATANLDFGVELPAGLAAYVAVDKAGVENTVELQMIEVNSTTGKVRIPAGTPIILKGAAGQTYSLTLIPRTPDNASTIGTNNLQGTYFSATPSGDYYTISSEGKLVKTTAEVADNKAYYVSASQTAEELELVLDAEIDVLPGLKEAAKEELTQLKSTQGDYYKYDIDAACAEIDAAESEEEIASIKANLAVTNPVTDGAIIKLWSNRNAYMYADGGLKIKTAVDVKNIWVAKATGTDDQFYLYNPYTGKYAGSTGAVNDNAALPLVDEASACPYSFEAEYPYVKIHDMSEGRNGNYQYMHAVSANNVVHWRAQSYAQNNDSYWKVYNISYDEVSASFAAIVREIDNYYEARRTNVGTGLGQYNFNNEAIAVAKAASTIEDIVASLPKDKLMPSINQPEIGRLYTIKSTTGNYACVPSNLQQGTACKTYETPNPAINIWRVERHSNGSYKLLSYASGYYYNNPNHAYMGWAAGINITEGNNVGTYNVSNMKDNGDNANISANASDHSDWIIEEIATLPVQFKQAAKGYATLWTPVALDVPAGVKAFVGTIGDDVIELESINTIPANTAVLLKTTASTSDTWINFKLNMTDESAAIAGSDNCFFGKADAHNVTAGTKMTLGRNEDNIGFYKFSGTTIRGFSGYIDEIPSSGNVRGYALSFGSDVETAIKTVLDAETDGVAYDLNGRRVQKAESGIYIVNGKKIVVK